MAGGVEGQRGGIGYLAAELDAHGEAIEYDLIALGLRIDWLGTPELSWRDLWVILRQSPLTSAYRIARMGEAALWSRDTHLLADIFDVLAGANWQRAGKASAPKPKPMHRPGAKRGTQLGAGALPIRDLEAWIAEAEAQS